MYGKTHYLTNICTILQFDPVMSNLNNVKSHVADVKGDAMLLTQRPQLSPSSSSAGLSYP